MSHKQLNTHIGCWVRLKWYIQLEYTKWYIQLFLRNLSHIYARLPNRVNVNDNKCLRSTLLVNHSSRDMLFDYVSYYRWFTKNTKIWRKTEICLIKRLIFIFYFILNSITYWKTQLRRSIVHLLYRLWRLSIFVFLN